MNSHKILFAALALASILTGCKKEEKETTYLYFQGSLSLEMPKYVYPGETYTFERSEVSTLKHAEDDETQPQIAYSFYNPMTAKTDTLDLDWTSYSMKVRDTLGSFTLTTRAFATGYSASSRSASFTVVNPDPFRGSVRNTGISREDPSFTDSRDGLVYYTSTLGGLTWMRNNLAYSQLGTAYEGQDKLTPLFGRFYTQEEALKACPDGWRLPTAAEFDSMLDSFGGNAGALMVYATYNGSRMWEHWSSVDVTNESGLGLLPTGYANNLSGEFDFFSFNDYSCIWTSDTRDGMGVYRYIYANNPEVFEGTQSRTTFAVPVRCVKEN